MSAIDTKRMPFQDFSGLLNADSKKYSIPDNGQVVGGAPFFWVHWCMPAPVYGREEYTPLGGEVRVEQEHQMHQMYIYIYQYI